MSPPFVKNKYFSSLFQVRISTPTGSTLGFAAAVHGAVSTVHRVATATRSITMCGTGITTRTGRRTVWLFFFAWFLLNGSRWALRGWLHFILPREYFFFWPPLTLLAVSFCYFDVLFFFVLFVPFSSNHLILNNEKVGASSKKSNPVGVTSPTTHTKNKIRTLLKRRKKSLHLKKNRKRYT